MVKPTHDKQPDHLTTVFAGMEREAVARAREYFQPYRPAPRRSR